MPCMPNRVLCKLISALVFCFSLLPLKTCLVGEGEGGESCCVVCSSVLATTRPPRGTNTCKRHVLSEPPSPPYSLSASLLLHGRGETSPQPPRHGLPLPSLIFLHRHARLWTVLVVHEIGIRHSRLFHPSHHHLHTTHTTSQEQSLLFSRSQWARRRVNPFSSREIYLGCSPCTRPLSPPFLFLLPP